MTAPYPVPPCCPLCSRPIAMCQCGTTPAAPAPKPARTFVKMGMYMVCGDCRMALPYCACDRQPSADPPALDGSASTLNARERALKGKR